MNKLNNYPFMGWDWMELAHSWNVYIPEDYWIKDIGDYLHNDYDPVVWLINSASQHYNGMTPTRPMRKMANDVRIYLRLLGDPDISHTFSSPLWIGLSNVEDDWTLLSYTAELIGGMWD